MTRHAATGDPVALQTAQCWRLADNDGITHITLYLVKAAKMIATKIHIREMFT
jgi:hypothetical protein